ncbi:DNA polymerase I [Corynebacterium guangdongense]
MAFRAFYALPAENFSTTGGQHTNAVYGFLSMLATLLAEEKPDHMAVAFDVGRQTFRTEMFPEYKAQREASPPEFKGQVQLLDEMLNILGITTLSVPNFEADDIIGTLATAANELDYETIIVTGDRDYFQLVNDVTTVLYPIRGVSNLARYTPEAVAEKYGLTPAQYPDFAALRGDPSDNLPNIPGVGEKTAIKWITQYGSLDALLANAEEIKGKAGDNFRERLDQVRMNRRLTQMITDMELEVGPDDLDFRPASVSEVAAKFDDLEFGVNLRERVLSAVPTDGSEIDNGAVELSDVVIDEEPLAQWLGSRAGQGLAVFTTGAAHPYGGDVTTLALADKDRHAVAYEMAELSPEDEQVLAAWLADADAPKYLHDAKAAFHMFAGRGLELNGIAHDTAVAAYLLRPGQRTYELRDVYQRHLQRTLAEPSDQLSLLDDGTDTTLVDSAVAVLELAEELTRQLQDIAEFELYLDLELPLVSILARMERVGIAVDLDVLEEQLSTFTAQTAEVERQAREVAGEPDLNLSSPKQLSEIMFSEDKLNLPKTKKTKTGYSTAAKEIEQLAAKVEHPFLDLLMQHREYQKMKTTLEGLIKTVQDDGRIHSTFKQTVASTGRLSSTEPNLQNIPVRTEAGRKIRSAFVVGEGYETLLTADYSQIEMRVMAHLSQDPGLIDAYQHGEDLHNYVGSKVFDVPIDQVDPDMRRRVKAMSYGLAYGLSAFGLSQQLSIPAGEAKAIMESYFERFGGVKAYLHDVVDQARKDGYTATVFGRRRYLPELNSDNRIARDNAERAALNAPIQGTAADIIKVAMIRVERALAEADLRSRVLLQVHDELVVEIAPGELERVQRILEHEMDGAITLRVPLEVSAGHGDNWDEAAH